MGLSVSYPKSLTDKDWQKKKGLITKILKGKTGISAKLTECEKQYADLSKKADLIEKISTPVETAELCGPMIDNLKKALGEVVKVCNERAKEWKAKTSPVPKSVREHVEDMSSEATKFANLLTGEFAKLKVLGKQKAKEIAKQIALIWSATIEPTYKAALEVDKSPDSTTFETKFLQKARALAAGLGKDKSRTKETSTWTTIANMNFIKGEDADGIQRKMAFVAEKIEELRDSLKNL